MATGTKSSGEEKKRCLFVSGGQTEDIHAAMRYLVESVRTNVKACIPVYVVGYNRIRHLVTVQPFLKNVMIDEDGKLYDVEPEPFEVPVRFPCFGGFSIDMPLTAGEKGWVFASDVDTLQVRRKELDYTTKNSIPECESDDEEDEEEDEDSKDDDTTDVEDEEAMTEDLPQKAMVLMSHFYDHGFFFPDCWSGFDVTKIVHRPPMSEEAREKWKVEYEEAQERIKTMKKRFAESGISNDEDNDEGLDEEDLERTVPYEAFYIGQSTGKTYELDEDGKVKKPGDDEILIDGLGSLVFGRSRVTAYSGSSSTKESTGSMAALLVEKENSVTKEVSEQSSVTMIATETPKKELEEDESVLPHTTVSLIGGTKGGEPAKIVIEYAKSYITPAGKVMKGYEDVHARRRIEIAIEKDDPNGRIRITDGWFRTGNMSEKESEKIGRFGESIPPTEINVTTDGVSCLTHSVDWRNVITGSWKERPTSRTVEDYPYPRSEGWLEDAKRWVEEANKTLEKWSPSDPPEKASVVKLLFGNVTDGDISSNGLTVLQGHYEDVVAGRLDKCRMLKVIDGEIEMRLRDYSSDYKEHFVVDEGIADQVIGWRIGKSVRINGGGIVSDLPFVRVSGTLNCVGGKKIGRCAYVEIDEANKKSDLAEWDANYEMVEVKDEDDDDDNNNNKNNK